MSAHTPGPCIIGDSDLSVSQMTVIQSESSRNHSTIARMAKGIQSLEEISANARLRAAAPALLKALKLIASTDYVDAALDPQRAVRVALAAIYKATGK